MKEKNKIVVNLIGGAGNQFFQYALGYTLAKKNNAELFVDISAFDTYTLRKMALDAFCVELNYADIDLIQKLKKKRLFNKTFYKEKGANFHPELLKIKGSAYIQGYFQSEKYFLDYKDDLKKMFNFKNFSFIKNDEILSLIRRSNAVSVNVRCGDYLSDPATRKIHFVCGKNYYKNALAEIEKRVSNPKYFVFSDDIEAAKGLLPEGYDFIFVDSANWQEDLYFMQNAKHNIIANSSFSWLAAYLNRNENKIVLAPDEWFTKESKINYKDIVPSYWQKVSTR